MHRYERLVLDTLKENKGELTLDRLVRETGLGEDETRWAIQNLIKQGMIEISELTTNIVVLTPEGARYAAGSLPETRLLGRLKEGTLEARNLTEEERIGFQWAKRKGFVDIKDGTIMLTDEGVKAFEKGLPEEEVLRELGRNSSMDKNDLDAAKWKVVDEFMKRKLVQTTLRATVNNIRITEKGRKFRDEGEGEGIGSLTKQMISTGSWKSQKFKKYDINVPVAPAVAGRRHPLARNIEDIRASYLANGFREVSGPIVESAFWVFDSLFQPQDHPARDAQDTFYLEGIEEMELGRKEFVERVRKAHTEGWHYRWSIETAQEAVLRTHTTSVSARNIYQILSSIEKEGKEYEFPIKLFSLGRIFRNENIDYRHLADFYQSDGVIIGKGLTFANLFDQIIKLYDWLGTELRFKPSYFPFVEPGVEIYAYAKGLDEWIEIGGAGMIRKEITGIRRKDISVLAWGVGVDRLMLIRQDNNVKSISELYNNSIGWVRRRKVV